MEVKIKRPRLGFTLIEALATIAVILIAFGAMFAMYNFFISLNIQSKAKLLALELATERIEVIHNLSYQDVGTDTGWPQNPNIPGNQQLTRNNLDFNIQTIIEFVDDPFDGDALGTIPEKPVDTEPADYKKVEVRVSWSRYPSKILASMTTNISPKGVESAPDTGSLFIQVLNASGLPVGQATVQVTNITTTPAIHITNTTDNDGNLLLPSLPEALDTYHIEVTKAGYSSDYTLDPDLYENPYKPDASVVIGEVTSATFYIDKVSSLSVKTVDETCSPLNNISFSLRGSKTLLKDDPSSYKFNEDFSTGDSGELIINNLEWDDYQITLNTSDYDLSGSTSPLPIGILPDSSQEIILRLVPHAENTILFTVKDAATGFPLSEASINLTNHSTYDKTLITGRGYLIQNDWSGGPGQESFVDPTKFFSEDGNIDYSSGASLSLKTDTQNIIFNESFETNDYKDAPNTTADWDTSAGLVQLEEDPLNPGSFLDEGIAQTTKLNGSSGEIISASLTVNEVLNDQTIEYFLSANGNDSFEAVNPSENHDFVITGNDLRFRARLTTTDPSKTPQVLSFSISYTIKQYRSSGLLESSTFDTETESNFDLLTWLPTNQLPETGSESVRLQIATNNDNATWSYLGPDGTATSYYTVSNSPINEVHNGNRYIRYKLYLSTEDPYYSPIISNIAILYSGGCIPPGQAFFDSLASGEYDFEVTLTGYNSFSDTININGNETYEVTLSPE